MKVFAFPHEVSNHLVDTSKIRAGVKVEHVLLLNLFFFFTTGPDSIVPFPLACCFFTPTLSDLIPWKAG